MYWQVPTHPAIKVGDPAGYNDGSGYKTLRLYNRKIQMHRAIFAIVQGRFPNKELDHIDRDRGNNRIENLREADRSLQMLNSKVSSVNLLGIKGVSFFRGRYRVWIRHKGQTVLRQSYATLEEAKQIAEQTYQNLWEQVNA